MSLMHWINFNILGDERGQLFSLECAKNIPFEIKRVYYLTGTRKGVSRGFHAHRALDQIALCVSGKCRMVLDDGKRREETWLESPSRALWVSKMIWREMHDFSDDCVMLVLASDHYDESDYIRDYGQFRDISKLMSQPDFLIPTRPNPYGHIVR